MGIIKWILGLIAGAARSYALVLMSVALIGALTWGGWQYKRYVDAQAVIQAQEVAIAELEAEADRQAQRLKQLAETAAQREERKQEWVNEALKWKNRMNKLIQENEDVAEWAHDAYRGQLVAD